jgi:hypothetical protein
MKRIFIHCGRKHRLTTWTSRIWYPALCGLVLMCLGAIQATAQYVSKTIATSNASLTIDGYGLAVDSSGKVYSTAWLTRTASQPGGPVIQQVAPSSALVAGSGLIFPGCGSSPTQTGFTDLGGLAVDAAGNLYLAQSGNGPVLRIGGGIVTCLTGSNSFWGSGVTPDGAGGAYFSVASTWEVYHVTAAGAITVVAGTSTQSGCGANSSSPSGTLLGTPFGLAMDPSGNLFIADRRCNVVWKFVPSTRALTVVAGTPNTAGYFGDNGPATQALLNQPTGVALDPDGNVYIADWANDAIRMVRNSDHTITTIAGTGLPGNYDDPNNAKNSTFNGPYSIAMGPGGNVYVGEDGKDNADVRELVLNGIATMLAPAPGSVLTSPASTFTWTTVANVDQYRLTMGSSAGLNDYFDDAGSILTTTKATVPNVPCDGRSLYVQLITKVDGYWMPAQQYTYTAPTQCAHMLNPPSGSTLGITQWFNWSAAPGASGYNLNVAYISPSGNTVTHSYSTTSTSFTVNNLPCDGKPILVQLSTVLNGVTMPPGNYAYTACKMLYLYATPTTLSASGGTVTLYLYAFAPPPGSATGQLSLTESVLFPAPLCIWNPFYHTYSCPSPTTLFSFPITTTYGQYYEYQYTLNIPAVPLGTTFATTEYGFNASFTINGNVVDTATATVTRY